MQQKQPVEADRCPECKGDWAQADTPMRICFGCERVEVRCAGCCFWNDPDHVTAEGFCPTCAARESNGGPSMWTRYVSSKVDHAFGDLESALVEADGRTEPNEIAAALTIALANLRVAQVLIRKAQTND